MNIKILGTKGEIAESGRRHSKQSGILIDGVLLLDIGEKIYLKKTPKWIVITHLHPDHAYFMRKGFEEIPETEALLYAPEKPIKKIKILNKKTKLGPYTITPIPTHHSKHVKSQAYLIEKEGISILYTGDLVWIDKKYHRHFRKIDLVITEGSFIREGGMIKRDEDKVYGHNGIPNLIRLFKPYTQKIVITHFGSWFFKDVRKSGQKLKLLGKQYGVSILPAYDGMHLYL